MVVMYLKKSNILTTGSSRLGASSVVLVLALLAPQVSFAQADQNKTQAIQDVLAPNQSGMTEADWLDQIPTLNFNPRQTENINELYVAMVESAAIQTAVLSRYRSETDHNTKIRIAYNISQLEIPEIAAAAKDWAQEEYDASARADGLHLLRFMPFDPDTPAIVRHVFDNEEDPAALAAAVWGLTPVKVPDPNDVAIIVPRLHELTSHPLADMRSAAIQRMPDWDKAQTYVEADVLRLMEDPDEEVRFSALGASSMLSLNSEAVKSAVFRLLLDQQSSLDMRSMVLMHMERFALTQTEYEIYLSAKKEIFPEG